MNSNQFAKLFDLRRRHPDHVVTEHSGPASVVLRCSCKKWVRTFHRINAMARVSKQFAAERKHLMDQESETREGAVA